MNPIIAIVLAALCGASFIQESIDLAKSNNLWKPVEKEEDSIFYGMSEDEIKAFLNAEIVPSYRSHQQTTLEADTVFDARTQWPSCANKIRNQGNCGSCWAHAAVEMVEWRNCIEHSISKSLSIQQLVSCDKTDSGCDGGLSSYALKYIATNGIVEESLYPYTGTNSACKIPSGSKTYVSSNSIVDEDTYESIESLRKEIFNNGPITVGFMVYKDFMSYSSGIYVKSSSTYEGGHAVLCVGYGTLNGVNYWIAQNSWGPSWGEKGHFRIKVGQCEFEDHYAWAKVQ